MKNNDTNIYGSPLQVCSYKPLKLDMIELVIVLQVKMIKVNIGSVVKWIKSFYSLLKKKVTI